MYLEFFGLKKDPFKITPDPEFFFSGGNRGAVLEALRYAVSRGEGIVKVVGEVGSGKTMLCRMLEQELPANCEIIYLANPRLSADEILHAIAYELQLPAKQCTNKLELLDTLQQYLLKKHANDQRVVMFIEEAQGMHIDTLEEIRMLSNLETTQEKLMQIVLFGQPELDDKLAAHEIRQLRERITYKFQLAPLNREEIRDYVNTRLNASGYRGTTLFEPRAIKLLARHSKGLLRRINLLADKALLAAFARGDHKVAARHLKMAVDDSDFQSSLMPRPLLASGITAFVAIAGLIWWAIAAGHVPNIFAWSKADITVSVETPVEHHHATRKAIGSVDPTTASVAEDPEVRAMVDRAKKPNVQRLPTFDGIIDEVFNDFADDPEIGPAWKLTKHFISFEALEVDTSRPLALDVIAQRP